MNIFLVLKGLKHDNRETLIQNTYCTGLLQEELQWSQCAINTSEITGGCLSFICLVHTDEKPFIKQVVDLFRANYFVASSLFPIPPSVFLLSKLLLMCCPKRLLCYSANREQTTSIKPIDTALLFYDIISHHRFLSATLYGWREGTREGSAACDADLPFISRLAWSSIPFLVIHLFSYS